MLRLFFVRLCRHLIGGDPHVVHFLVGASHVMGVALSAVYHPFTHAAAAPAWRAPLTSLSDL